MHRLSFAVASLAAFGSLAQAGNLYIVNLCATPLYQRIDYPGGVGAVTELNTFPDPAVVPLVGQGIAIKYSTRPDMAGPLGFSFSSVAGTIWYDLNTVDGNPWADTHVYLSNSHGACPAVTCPGQNCMTNGNGPGVEACPASNDLDLTFCGHAN
ncbi:hypothetical protein LTR66_001327 [Elasticomyces elasticus]|nr:hypothetical protein LTR50_006236 [Elasticomyces elasticus]KAK4999689.1 hypothetical protein LTR66_001327 [Elasticomyces elasticus]